MITPRFIARLLGLAALSLAAATGNAAPQAWPNGPITFIAPFSPGGGGDTMVRLYAAELGKRLATNFIVENKPGAGGNIGTAYAARAVADGNTVVFGTNGTMGTNHALYKNPGFSIDDFEPVAPFGFTALALVVGKNSPIHTMKDLIDQARKRPGQLSCASGGNGTASHLACMLLQQMAGIDVVHIPYKSSSTAYIDMESGRVSFMIDVLPPLTPHIQSGALRAVAVTMKERVPALPDTPVIADTVSGYEMFAWDGLFAPKGTPADRLDKLHAAVTAAAKDPAFRKAMNDRGTMMTTMDRKEFAGFVKKEAVRMGEVVRKTGVTLD